MDGIYIESEKIRERKDIVEWLDGCGIKNESGLTFSKFFPKTSTYVYFAPDPRSNFVNDYKFFTYHTQSKYIQTPEQFCELIAECLGIDKPVFGQVDISETETTTDPIKGMAIDVKLFTQDERIQLSSLIPDAENSIRQSVKREMLFACYPDGFGFASLPHYSAEGLTITDSPQVFMEYVAQRAGKEYIRKLEITPEIRDKIQAKIKDRLAPPSYPHKTYRILDSLDGIPLDKRFKLSEWVPPYDAEVAFIYDSRCYYGKFYCIYEAEVVVIPKGHTVGSKIGLDGEWMRVV